jgi:hypothetical protein
VSNNPKQENKKPSVCQLSRMLASREAPPSSVVVVDVVAVFFVVVVAVLVVVVVDVVDVVFLLVCIPPSTSRTRSMPGPTTATTPQHGLRKHNGWFH